MNHWPLPQQGPTVGAMPSVDRSFFASITTPRGSVITFPNLTEEEAEVIAVQHSQPADLPVLRTADKTKSICGQCQGKGGWEDLVETKSKGGSIAVSKRWVNCRPCGGTGQTPK